MAQRQSEALGHSYGRMAVPPVPEPRQGLPATRAQKILNEQCALTRHCPFEQHSCEAWWITMTNICILPFLWQNLRGQFETVCSERPEHRGFALSKPNSRC